MPVLRLVVCALLLAPVAMAHTGVPGHIHPEMTTAQQVVHAAVNWAPVVGVVLLGGWQVRKALRGRAR